VQEWGKVGEDEKGVWELMVYGKREVMGGAVVETG